MVRPEGEARVTLPQNGALARTTIYEDIGKLAKAIRHADQVRIDAVPFEFASLKSGSCIMAEGANISRGEAPLPTGNQSAGYLAPWKYRRGTQFKFRIKLGEARKCNDGVSCIDTHTDDIGRARGYFLCGHGGYFSGVVRQWKEKAMGAGHAKNICKRADCVRCAAVIEI